MTTQSAEDEIAAAKAAEAAETETADHAADSIEEEKDAKQAALIIQHKHANYELAQQSTNPGVFTMISALLANFTFEEGWQRDIWYTNNGWPHTPPEVKELNEGRQLRGSFRTALAASASSMKIPKDEFMSERDRRVLDSSTAARRMAQIEITDHAGVTAPASGSGGYVPEESAPALSPTLS